MATRPRAKSAAAPAASAPADQVSQTAVGAGAGAFAASAPSAPAADVFAHVNTGLATEMQQIVNILINANQQALAELMELPRRLQSVRTLAEAVELHNQTTRIQFNRLLDAGLRVSEHSAKLVDAAVTNVGTGMDKLARGNRG